jgi:hypothetical protein
MGLTLVVVIQRMGVSQLPYTSVPRQPPKPAWLLRSAQLLGPSPSIGAGLSTCQTSFSASSSAIGRKPRKPMWDVPDVMRKRRSWLMPVKFPDCTWYAVLGLPMGVAPLVPTFSK